MAQLIREHFKIKIQDRRKDNVKSLIRRANDSFTNAIKNLELNKAANDDIERSMLDQAIYISLNILELILHFRIIDGKDVHITKEQAELVDKGKWKQFVKKLNRTALTYLDMIDDLERLQRRQDNPNLLYTAEFANRNRRGLKVISYEYIRQYEAYCKGLCMHQCGYINKALAYYS